MKKILFILLMLGIVVLAVALVVLMSLLSEPVDEPVASKPQMPQEASTPFAFPATWTPLPPTATPTPQPTHTLVIKPGEVLPPIGVRVTATPSANAYGIVVPTPTAATIKYPVAFESSLKVITYTVTGKTANEISQSLNANLVSDLHDPTRKYPARTDWNLRLDFSAKPAATGCEVGNTSVSLLLTMTLPMLTPMSGVEQDALNRWNKYIEVVIAHESDHAKLGLQGARDLQRELGNLSPTANCDSLKVQVNNVYDRYAQSIDRANVDYDAKTKAARRKAQCSRKRKLSGHRMKLGERCF